MKNPLLYPANGQEVVFDTVRRDKNIQNLKIGTLVENIFLGTRFSLTIDDLYNLATNEAETIKFRNDMIDDLISNPKLEEAFFQIPSALAYLKEFTRKMEFRESDICKVALNYRRLSLYANLMNGLKSAFTDPNVVVKSEAIQVLKGIVDEFYHQDEIDNMLAEFAKVDTSWLDIRSFALGANLKNGAILQNMTIANFDTESHDTTSIFVTWKEGDINGVSNLKAMPNISNIGLFQDRVLDMIKECYEKPVKEIKKICSRYKPQGLQRFQALDTAFSFYAGALNLVRRLRAMDFAMCKPEIIASERFFLDAKEMYPIELALDPDNNTIKNEVSFPGDGKFYLLTGANSSGKSTYMTSTGQLIWLFQLGYWLPADVVKIAPVNSIFTIFSGGETDNYEDSRMGEEVRQIKEMLPNVTANSVIIMNEPLTSTSPMEGSEICADLIRTLLDRNASGVIATHFYELYDFLPQIDKIHPGKTGSLITVTIPDPKSDIAIRTYKIKIGSPQKKSYALEVAATHGITLRQMHSRFEDRGIHLELTDDILTELHSDEADANLDDK